MHTFFFYSRTSTVLQNESRQIENFKKHVGYDPSRVYLDKVQGNVPFLERKEASRLFDIATSSSKRVTVVVDSTDRLGRDMLDVMSTIKLFTTNGISINSLKEGFTTLLDSGEECPTSKLILGIMSSISEMEKNRIRIRTAEGIQIARAQGKFKGRKPGSVQSKEKLLERHAIVVKKLNRGLTIRDIARITGKSTTTIMKVKKAIEED